jgi:hypothetical protein
VEGVYGGGENAEMRKMKWEEIGNVGYNDKMGGINRVL